MRKSKQKHGSIEISDELTIEHHKEKSSTEGNLSLRAGLQNKKVQGSLLSIAALAACGAAGYALTRPSNKRRMSRYSTQISSYLPGLSRKPSRTERIATQIADLVDGAFKR